MPAEVNKRLPKLPSEIEILRAVRDIPDRDPRARGGVTANLVAQYLRVQGARRLGRGAVKGSWSGTMSPSLRIAPRLNAMVRQGLLFRFYDTKSYRYVYALTLKGNALTL